MNRNSNSLRVRGLLLFVVAMLCGQRTLAGERSVQDSLWGVWRNESLHDTVRIRALSDFTWMGYLFSQPDSAYHYGQIMYDYAASKGLKKWMAYALRGQGVSFKVRGRNAKAIDYWLRSLDLSAEVNDLVGVAGSLNNLGILYYEQGDLAKALEYHERSLAMRERCGDFKGLGASLVNIGRIHEKRGEYDQAMEYYERCVANGERIQFERGIASALTNMGVLYRDRGDTKRALEHFERSLVVYRKENNKLSEANCITEIGLTHLARGKTAEALLQCEHAMAIAAELRSLDEQERACDCMYKAHKALGHRDQAMRAIELARAFGDSIEMEATTERLQRMEFVQELRTDSILQAKERERVEFENQAALARMKNRTNIFLFSSIGVLVLAAGLWSRLRYTRRAKEEADALRQRAERSERVKQQFLANMSHEIRTPMHAIMGMTGILQRNAHPAQQDRYLDAIKQSSENLLVILNDILDLSKIEAGKIVLETVPFSPRLVLDQVCTILRFKAEEKGLELICTSEPDVPAVLHGDPTRLQQVLLNLAGNAIKFTDRGAVTVRASTHEQAAGRVSLRVDVIDSGIGIAEEKQASIFREFDQAYSDTTRKYGGTGLGLSICKHLVELQGGTIAVYSEKDKGSIFTIIIPYTPGAATAPMIGYEGMLSGLRDLRILLAEDNQFNVIVAQDELADAIPGALVDVARTGGEAVELASTNSYDVILMDVQMPEMNGFDATRSIRALQGTRSGVPIIAMTANVLKEEVDRCRQAGMDAHVPKPFTREELMSALFKVLRPNDRM